MGSLLDGFPTPEEIVDRAIAIGHDSIAVTDHGSMAASLQFYLAAKKKGIKPIVGVEGYFTLDRHSREKDARIHHMGLLAKNYEGYQNLCQISDIAWNQGFYKKPRFDIEVLNAHSKGIIALSGCMDGVVSWHLRNGDTDSAVEWHMILKDLFKDDYFIEIQPWNPDGLNKELIELAEHTGVKIVATADSHYCTQEDSLAEEVALLINQQGEMKVREKEDVKGQFEESRTRFTNPMARINFLYPNRRLRFDGINNYIMTRRNLELRMLDAGYDIPEAYDNTLEVAERIDDWELPLQQDYLPKFVRNVNSDDYLTDLAFDKLRDRKLDSPEYVDRLAEELDVIKKLGFADYMLIIWDACNWAKNNDIMTGPGRGSVGGSLLAYVLGITRVDPMKHGLLFWRFLNVDESGASARIEPPDIDTDVEDVRRDEVKAYLLDRWKHVASISAVTKFSSKGMVRDLSRVFAIPLVEVNEVCKHFNNLEEFLSSDSTKRFREKYPEIPELARKFEGRWRFQGVHAAGVVVADRPIETLLPIESRDAGVRGKERIRATAFDMDDVQRLGLIKMDMLGLSMLTIINDCLKAIKAGHGIDIDLDSLELEDKDVLDEFTMGHTVGVFQVDTQTYTGLLKGMRVDSFNDLMASNALVRPGPLTTVTPQYIKRKHGKEAVPREHEKMAAITSETYGLIIYQEQLMQALVDIGGFSQAEADKVRKIIGKKRDENEFKPFENKWVENASQILSQTRAKKLWKDFLKFAGYAFNKSHACEYSVLSYQTMWLKKYYPVEFMYALLKNETDKDRITTFTFEAKRLGLNLAMPDINKSGYSFTIEDEKTIRFGLTNIAAVGDKAAKDIMEKRPFKSFEDFIDKINRRSCNQNAIDSLVNVGAFRELLDTDIDYSSNYYALLGLAQNVSEHEAPVDTTPLEERVKEELTVIMGLVKSVVRKPEWMKINVEDASSGDAFFATPDYEIEEGRIVLAMVLGSDWIGHVYLDEVDGTSSIFSDFLLHGAESLVKDYQIMYNHGIGRLDSDKALVVPIHIRYMKVRNGMNAGKTMASVVVTDGERVEKVVVFPKSFAKCGHYLKEFQAIVIKKQYTKSGDITVTEDGIRPAGMLMEEKGL
jgi:DNA polymerase-3 subunit alpha